MKNNNTTKFIVVFVIFLISVLVTLPSTPIWDSVFGSLSLDEQKALPISSFEYKENAENNSVMMTMAVESFADLFTKKGKAPKVDEFLDNISETIRQKLIEMNYDAVFSKTDRIDNRKTLEIKSKTDEKLTIDKLKSVIADSKLYAKIPLYIVSSLSKVLPQKKITLGLDLKGGIDIVYQVDVNSIEDDDEGKADKANTIRDAVNRSVEIIRNRIDMYGVAEPSIKVQEGNRIRVQLPGVKDTDAIKRLIKNTAMLKFHIVLNQAISASELQPVMSDEILLMSQGNKNQMPLWYKLKRRPDLTGKNLKYARTAFDQVTNQPIVNIEFDPQGRQLFAKVTSENVHRQLAIVLDNTVYSAPEIQTPITGGMAQISGRFSIEEANSLSIVLRAGALPANLIEIESRVIGPTLGQRSIKAGFIAGALGFVLVILYMFIFYGTCGIVADIALIFNSLIVFASMVLFGGTMTMPGIAGFILSLGMAVDANVIIFERIKEEYRSGKTVRASIASGFDRAFSCILDSNITTLLVVAILYYNTTGAIRGFATTLGIGLLANLYTAVFFSKLCLEKWFVGHEDRKLGL